LLKRSPGVVRFGLIDGGPYGPQFTLFVFVPGTEHRTNVSILRIGEMLSPQRFGQFLPTSPDHTVSSFLVLLSVDHPFGNIIGIKFRDLVQFHVLPRGLLEDISLAVSRSASASLHWHGFSLV
jgi:hypothetical protein